MSLIPDLSEVKELTPVADGEYDLRIIQAKEKEASTGRKGIMLIHEIVGEDDATNLIDTMWLPMESDDDNKKNTMYRMMKERLIAMGLPTDGTELEDFINVEFTAYLEYEDDPDYGARNNIKRII